MSADVGNTFLEAMCGFLTSIKLDIVEYPLLFIFYLSELATLTIRICGNESEMRIAYYVQLGCNAFVFCVYVLAILASYDFKDRRAITFTHTIKGGFIVSYIAIICFLHFIDFLGDDHNSIDLVRMGIDAFGYLFLFIFWFFNFGDLRKQFYRAVISTIFMVPFLMFIIALNFYHEAGATANEDNLAVYITSVTEGILALDLFQLMIERNILTREAVRTQEQPSAAREAVRTQEQPSAETQSLLDDNHMF